MATARLDPQDMRALREQVAKDIKEQQDRKQDAIAKRTITINPQVLSQSNPSTYGPYYFYTSYSLTPSITFGQARVAQTRIKGAFVVMPYVDSWISDSGGIKGFNLGILALTGVPDNLTKHTIMWNLQGKASLYKDDGTTDSWKQSYNNRAASHLVADSGELEQPG